MHDLFAPSADALVAVKEWLTDSGIPQDRHLDYESKGWIGINLAVKEAERLFKTRYHEHESAGGEVRLGCDAYYLPRHIAQHVDYITPGVKLSAPLKKRTIQARNSKSGGWWPRRGHPGPPSFPSWHFPPWSPPPHAGGLPADLQGCAFNFTAICYRALYNIPNAYERGWNVSGNSLGLYEDGDIYSQQDLDLYFKTYANYIPQGTSPIPAFIDGAQAPVAAASEYNTGESDIDLAITMSLVRKRGEYMTCNREWFLAARPPEQCYCGNLYGR